MTAVFLYNDRTRFEKEFTNARDRSHRQRWRGQDQYFCGDVGPQPIFLNTTVRTEDLVTLPGVPANVTVLGASAYNTAQGVAFSGVERDLAIVSLIGNWNIAGSGYTMNVSTAWRDEERSTGSDSEAQSIWDAPRTRSRHSTVR